MAMTPAEFKELLDKTQKGLDDLDKKFEENEEKGLSRTENLEKQIEELKQNLTEIEKNQKNSEVSLPGLEAEKEKFSFVQAFNGVLFNRWGKGFEKTVLEEATNKAVVDTGTSGAGGGYTVPVEIMGPIIPALTDRTRLRQLGAKFINPPANTGKLEMPRQITMPSVSWKTENSALSETNPVLENFSLDEHRFGCFVRLTERLLNTSIVGMEDFVRDSMLTQMALTMDLAAFTGDSGVDANSPDGLVNITGVTELSFGPDANTGKELDIYDLALFEEAIEDNNALGDNDQISFVGSPKIFRKLRNQRILQYSGDTLGKPLVMPMSYEELQNLIGHKIYGKTDFPTDVDKGTSSNCTYLFAGVFTKYIVALWQNMRIAKSTEACDGTNSAFLNDEVWVKVSGEVDFNVEQPKAFVFTQEAITPTSY